MNAKDMEAQLQSLAAAFSGRQIKHVYLTGCGGGLANLRPGEYLLLRNLPEGMIYSSYCAELMCEYHPGINEKALVIVGSFNGTMKEAVEAMRWAKQKGAFVIGVTYVPDTPIAMESDFGFLCDHIECEEPAVSPMCAGVLLASAVIDYLTGKNMVAEAFRNMLRIRQISDEANENIVESRKEEFVARFRKSPMIYTIGGGLNYMNAYILATCYLTEMQWMNACPVNATEFFHGVLEIADKDSHFILMLGRGEGRVSEERVQAFLHRFTRGTFVLDAKEFKMEGISEEFETIVGVIVMARAIRSLIHSLADARRHPLNTRRYYLKSDY